MIGDILQPTHLLFVLAVALLVLGPKRLPEVGRQLGSGLRDFRAAINGERSEHHDEELDAEPTIEAEQRDSPAAAPTEDEFAHQDADTSAEEHRFAHQEADTVVDDHRFAHGSPEMADEHEPGHAGTGAVPGHAVLPETPQPAGEHEFAYEPTQPAEKPVDPLG